MILAAFGENESAEGGGTTRVDLAVAKRLVSAMEGEVGFERDPERGIALWFAVRLAEVAATDWGAPEAKMAG
jgi:hypothetical protein